MILKPSRGPLRVARFTTKKEAEAFASSVVKKLKKCELECVKELTILERVYFIDGKSELSSCRWGVLYYGRDAFGVAHGIANTLLRTGAFVLEKVDAGVVDKGKALTYAEGLDAVLDAIPESAGVGAFIAHLLLEGANNAFVDAMHLEDAARALLTDREKLIEEYKKYSNHMQLSVADAVMPYKKGEHWYTLVEAAEESFEKYKACLREDVPHDLVESSFHLLNLMRKMIPIVSGETSFAQERFDEALKELWDRAISGLFPEAISNVVRKWPFKGAVSPLSDEQKVRTRLLGDRDGLSIAMNYRKEDYSVIRQMINLYRSLCVQLPEIGRRELILIVGNIQNWRSVVSDEEWKSWYERNKATVDKRIADVVPLLGNIYAPAGSILARMRELRTSAS